MQKWNQGNRFSQVFEYLHEHIIAVIIIVAVTAAVVSTGFIIHDDRIEDSTDVEIREYQSMDTVYFAMDEVQSLNPLSSEEADTYYISQMVFSSLFRLNDTLNIEKDLVERYDVKTKSGKVQIHLKDNVKFTNGSALTAEDVKFTIHQIRSIGKESPYYADVSKIDNIEVVGDRQLTIAFKNPADAALDHLVFPIVSHEHYDAEQMKPIGSGQYKYGSYTNHKLLKLYPNDQYYGTKAKNKLEFKVIADKSKTPGLMTIDSITAAVTTDSAVAVEAEDKDLQVTAIPSNEMEYMGFNFKNKYLKEKRVRQAIAKTINLETIINDSYGGSGLISETIYFPGFLGTENQGDPYEPDQVGASELLKDCGFTDQDENGILEDKEGKEISISVLVNSNNESRTDAAETIAAELNKIGIKTSVNSVPWKAYKKALQNKKFDLYLGGYEFDPKYNLKEMFAKNNKLSYNNQDVLGAAEKLETAITAEEQKTIYENMKTVLIEEIPYYCLCYKSYYFLAVERFQGTVIPSFHSRYAGCDAWQWERVLTTKVEEEESEETSEN